MAPVPIDEIDMDLSSDEEQEQAQQQEQQEQQEQELEHEPEPELKRQKTQTDQWPDERQEEEEEEEEAAHVAAHVTASVSSAFQRGWVASSFGSNDVVEGARVFKPSEGLTVGVWVCCVLPGVSNGRLNSMGWVEKRRAFWSVFGRHCGLGF